MKKAYAPLEGFVVMADKMKIDYKRKAPTNSLCSKLFKEKEPETPKTIKELNHLEYEEKLNLTIQAVAEREKWADPKPVGILKILTYLID